MSQELSSAAPWRTAASMSPICTLEENCTDTEGGNSPGGVRSICRSTSSQCLALALLACFSFLPVRKEEASPDQEKSPSLVQVKLEPPQIKEGIEKSSHSLAQEKLEPPQIKEEQEEILLSPGEVAGSSGTLLPVKSEDDDENRETESLASTSMEHIKTQAYIKYWVPSQPTSDKQLLSSHYSGSDTDDSDDWDTRDDETVVNSLESHNTYVEGQGLSLSNNLSQNPKSLKQKPSRRSQTRKKSHCCTECGKVCGRKRDLEKHMRIHTGEKPFTCTVCNKGFNQTENLRTHMRIHTGSQTRKKSHCCTECGKECGRKGDLEKHMRIHTGEKPFTCTVCNKSFNQTENLRTHMRIHTGKKPFACSICSKSFSQTENLKTHMRIHTGEKPFACTVCCKSFNQSQHLKTHMRSHTGEKPFACTVCNKSFKHKHSLKTHMSIHTGEKPFICICCNKRFNKTVSLKTHMRIHTGEKPFACTVCSKSFKQPQHLKTHMKIHPIIKLPNGSAVDSGLQVDTTKLATGPARHTVVPIRPKPATNTVQVSAMRIVTLVAPALLQSAPQVTQTLRGSAVTIVTPGAICGPPEPRRGPPGAAGPPDATGLTDGL